MPYRLLRLVPVAALLAGTAVWAAPPASAVSYGSLVEAPARTVPWVVRIGYAPTDGERPRFICTGSALSPTEVLTAAHCVTDQNGFYFIGVDANRAGGGRWVPVEAVVDHPRYSDSRAVNDIALLRPLMRLELSGYAQLGTGKLARKIRGTRPPALRIYGWGLDQNRRPSRYLRFAGLTPQTRAATRTFGAYFRPTLMLAAGKYHRTAGTYSGACNGDSGGPLVVQVNGATVVAGVTSYGRRGCDLRSPTVFTSVGDYRTWLAGARTRLPKEAVTRNRALPVSLSDPTVAGSPSLGSTLTCATGQWTANADTVTYGWTYTDSGELLHLGRQHVIVAADAGRSVVCVVLAESAAGSALAVSAEVRLVPAPYSFLQPAISGLPVGSALPSPGTVARCAAPSYAQPGVTLTYRWAVSPDYSSPGTGLGAGPTLTVTEDVLRAVAGKYLVCTVRAANAMGSQTTEVRRYNAAAFAPNISVNLPNTMSAGTTLTCSVSNYGGAATSITYRWGIQSTYPADALSATAMLLPSTSSTYLVTAGDMANLSGKYLGCEATASSWAGSDTDATGILG